MIYAVGPVSVVGACVVSWLAIGAWRDDPSARRRLAATYVTIFGTTAKAGAYARSIAALAVASWGLVIIAAGYAWEMLAGGRTDPALGPDSVVMFAGGFVLFAGVVFQQTIVRYNAPRFLVPPAMRNEDGLVKQKRR